jgi:L-threonylcarbamoyladenylate synthase
MKYYKIDAQNPDTKIIKEAVKCLNNDGLIVYPTDTLYGIGVDAYSRKAVNKLYLLKQRDMRKPVSIMLNSLQQIKEIFGFSPECIREDLEKILPGPYTAVIKNSMQKKIPIFEEVNSPGSYLEKVGIRIPAHPVSSALSYLFDSPISCTSANISGRENTFSVENIIAQFGSEIDLIIDAGPIIKSKGSTVIDFTKEPYFVIREGDVSEKKLQKIFGRSRITKRKENFNITFVCSGNICRSPMAEALFKKMIMKTKYKDFIIVQSAGTLSIPVSHAHDYAINVCDENDVELIRHLSQPITREIVMESDIIFCMAQNHFSYLTKRYPEYKEKVFLLKQWKKNTTVSIPSIADPIGHDMKFFRATFNEIRSELKRILPAVLELVKNFSKFHELN